MAKKTPADASPVAHFEQSLDELAQTAATGGRGGIVVDTP